MPKILYTPERIAARVGALGASITGHYPLDEPLLVLGFLKGSFIFMADLVRQIKREVYTDFLIAKSYEGTESTGSVELLYAPSWKSSEIEPARTHLLLVEDVIDTGRTLEEVIPTIETWGFKSIEVCTLLHKRIVLSAAEYVMFPRWVGFQPPEAFVLGYGLDHDGKHRNLPYILRY